MLYSPGCQDAEGMANPAIISDDMVAIQSSIRSIQPVANLRPGSADPVRLFGRTSQITVTLSKDNTPVPVKKISYVGTGDFT